VQQAQQNGEEKKFAGGEKHGRLDDESEEEEGGKALVGPLPGDSKCPSERRMELYTEQLHKTKTDGAPFQGPADRSHLRLGMQILGMVYTCEIIGFLKLTKRPPVCTNKKGLEEQWVNMDWVYTYERPRGLWTVNEYGPDSSDPVCYDLAEAIRAWLKQNEVYKGLSMCEVALIDPEFTTVRELVQPADVFWSHVQRETVGDMYRNMIGNGGGGKYNSRAAAAYYAAQEGVWPSNFIWVDMFSLRQGTSDFNVRATVELIRDISFVDATANGGYFERSFCLLETYAVVSSTGELAIHNAGEDVAVNSAKAGTRNPEDADQVRIFIKDAFGGGDAAFADFDKILEGAIASTVQKKEEFKHLIKITEKQGLKLPTGWKLG
jgi:hypothetical protein